MAKERAITGLKIHPADVAGQKQWVYAEWERADGSKGSAIAHLRWKTPERLKIYQVLIEPAYLRDVPVARIEQASNADPIIRARIYEAFKQAMGEDFVKPIEAARAKRPRLKRPKSRRLDDDFYRRVADAYRGAVLHGLGPAPTLAADADTPIGTVHRWITTARDKGYLPETSTGVVDAAPVKPDKATA